MRPLVELNRVVAIAMVDGPATALGLLAPLEAGDLRTHHLLHATRADLERRAGNWAAAATAYDAALALVRTEPEQRYLERRRAEVAGEA